MNPRPLVGEAIGTAILLFVIVGASIMAETLGSDPASQLIAQAIAVGLALGAAIAVLQVISGAHFNPSVSIAMWRSNELDGRETAGYIAAQCVGAVAGVVAANASFGRSLISVSDHVRTGWELITSEAIATFVLVLVILLLVRTGRAAAVPVAVGAWVTAIVFATASTGFANPVVTVARTLTDAGAGIAPASVAAFVAIQLIAGLAAVPVARFLFPQPIVHTIST